jgi:hypothetical protein
MSWHKDHTLAEISLTVATIFSILILMICSAAGGFILGLSLALCVWVCFFSLFLSIKICEKLMLLAWAHYNQKKITELDETIRKDIIKYYSDNQPKKFDNIVAGIIIPAFLIIAGSICFIILTLTFKYYQ